MADMADYRIYVTHGMPPLIGYLDVSLGGGAASYIARACSIAGATGEAARTLHYQGRNP